MKEINKEVKAAFDEAIKRNENGYIVSWWLANNLNMKTAKVNSELKKYVATGELHFVSTCYSTKFYPANTQPNINTFGIKSTSDPRFESGIAKRKEV